MLIEKFKELCLINNWNFNYGANHWQNLGDFELDYHLEFEDRKKHFLLLWKDREIKINDYNAVTGYEFTGEIVFCVRSKIDDPDYNFKYENNIKHLELEAEKVFKEFTTCDDWEVSRWREVEVTNQYDTNLDGLKIEFTMIRNGE